MTRLVIPNRRSTERNPPPTEQTAFNRRGFLSVLRRFGMTAVVITHSSAIAVARLGMTGE
jgi:hypothetical protein